MIRESLSTHSPDRLLLKRPTQVASTFSWPSATRFPAALDSVSFSGKKTQPPQDSQKLSAASFTPEISAPKLAAPQVSLPGDEDSLMPLLKAEDVDIHVNGGGDKVLIGDRLKLVDYDDLAKTDLLPKDLCWVPSMEKHLLRSRFIDIDNNRRACLLYVPSAKGKTYIPRPVYQSSSHGAWQAPNYIVRHWNYDRTQWLTTYFGKGLAKRGKSDTALSPEIQKFLSRSAPKRSQKLNTTADQKNVLVGVINNVSDWAQDYDQSHLNHSVDLETLYPGSRIDSTELGFFSGKQVPLSPAKFKLEEKVRPDFSKRVMTYNTQNRMYDNIRAEVYASKDDQLLWTYYVQASTKRAWVAHAHMKNSKIMETGLPETLVNIGNTAALAPYEYYDELAGTTFLNQVGYTPYADIWKKYTSKLPLVRDYYEAKGQPCPN